MATGSSSGSGDFEALMRQYWNTWGPAAAHATASAGQAPPTAWPWQAMLDSANPLWGAATTGGAEDAAHRFNSQAGDWLGTMQQVAARFAGRDSSSAEVAAAWREAVQGQEGGLLRWMLDAARGGNALGDQPWIREFSRWAQGGFGSQEPWLNIPGFGPAREHQARWQALLKMQQHYQTRAEAYVEQIRSVLDEAFQLFEQRLGAHESPGSQLTSARAMFDLWIDVAEEAYSKAALSEEFREIYAELANAQMRLRAATQHELEKACEVMGVPTRSEMDAAHRKIAELERLLWRMAAAAPSTTAPPSADQAAPAPRARAASKATANKATAAKAAPARPRKRAPAAGKSR